MTSFAFEGLALGGPANGRVLISYTEIYRALYILQADATNRSAEPLIRSQQRFGTFRYHAHQYGEHQFFLPAHQSLNYFLTRWNPPKEQNLWPSFLQTAVQILAKA